MTPSERNAIIGSLELVINVSSTHSEEGCALTYLEHLGPSCTCKLEISGAELVDEVCGMLQRLAMDQLHL